MSTWLFVAVIKHLNSLQKCTNKRMVSLWVTLGSALANIFVDFREERLFDCDKKPGVYFRYVDGTYFFKIEAEYELSCYTQAKPSVITLFLHNEEPFFKCILLLLSQLISQKDRETLCLHARL